MQAASLGTLPGFDLPLPRRLLELKQSLSNCCRKASRRQTTMSTKFRVATCEMDWFPLVRGRWEGEVHFAQDPDIWRRPSHFVGGARQSSTLARTVCARSGIVDVFA